MIDKIDKNDQDLNEFSASNHINHLNLAVYSGIASKLFNIPVVATAHGKWDSVYFFQDLITKFFVNYYIPMKNNIISKTIVTELE